jgi:hypothetical protein
LTMPTTTGDPMNQTNTVDTEELRRLEVDIRRRTAAGIDPSPSEARALLTALDAARAEATEALALANDFQRQVVQVMRISDAFKAERDAARASLDDLARDVGQAICAATLQPGESLTAPRPHAIVSTVLQLVAERDAARAKVKRLRREVRLADRSAVGALSDAVTSDVEVVALRAEVVRERRRTWEAWCLAHWWHTEEATSCRLAKERREEMKAAQAEAARERRGREVAEAREAYLMARFMPTSEPGADDRRDAAYARLCEVESAIGAEVGR